MVLEGGVKVHYSHTDLYDIVLYDIVNSFNK